MEKSISVIAAMVQYAEKLGLEEYSIKITPIGLLLVDHEGNYIVDLCPADISDLMSIKI